MAHRSIPPGQRRAWAIWIFGLGIVALGGLAAVWYAFDRRLVSRGEMSVGLPLKHEWRSIGGKHWQVTTTGPIEDTAVTDARERSNGHCERGMVEVAGQFKLEPSGAETGGLVEAMQDRTCTDWISKEFPARCAEFDRSAWLAASAKLPTKPLNFCIDRFEYPNRLGENPTIVVTYTEAAGLCRTQGKRLCSESEWTLACEGDEATPYPNSYKRDQAGCVVDQPWRPFSPLSDRDSDQARAEVDKLWQGMPSGSRPNCRSAFGVYDMTGNVDEWTKTVRNEGFASVLKGGYWGPVRARCRPATRAHDESFVAYQQGFRCCSDVGLSDAGAQDASSRDSSLVIADAGMESNADSGVNPAAVPTAGDSRTRAVEPSDPRARALDLWRAGTDAGALSPDEFRDEGEELLKRKKVAPGCGGASVAGHGQDCSVWSLVALVCLARFRRKLR